MKNKKGFTLIELLAVIVILAVIALIVTPIVTGIITSAKESANARSVEGHIKNVEYAMTSSAFSSSGELTKFDGNTVTNDDLVANGAVIPTSDTIVCESYVISSGTVLAASKCNIGGKDYYYAQGKNASLDATIVVGISVPVTFAKGNGTVIYFNPETGVKCTSAEAVSTTGNKTGCMKWYVFNDEVGVSTVNLILDHNTTALVAWNSSNSNVSGPKELTTQLWTDTANWSGVPTRTDSYSISNGTATYTIDYNNHKARLITATEIAKITGNTTYSEATPSDGNFYFDSNTSTASTTCTEGNITGCKYGWLYDRTSTTCENYGCSNNSDASMLGAGYWEITPTYNSSVMAWAVAHGGGVTSVTSRNDLLIGLRPVITIPKALVY